MVNSNKIKGFSGVIILLLATVFLSVTFIPSDSAAEVFDSIMYTETNVADYSAASEMPDVQLPSQLIPGGFPFGVKFYTKGVIVVGVSEVESESGFVSPASDAGFKKGDIITSVNGEEVDTIERIAYIIENCNGTVTTFTVNRLKETLTLSMTPVKALSDGKYKSGMWIRDSTAGIGTVTFINADTLRFGGLGHGICDTDTGMVMPLSKGMVVDVSVTGIIRGVGGRPGELKGDFGSVSRGYLTNNCSSGVFGVFSALPQKVAYPPFPVASKNEVTTGKAQIYSSILDGQNKIYDIEITKVNHHSQDTKNFIISITDPSLIELTGGIIQGMSGSPIIQNGKIIGAVTHVFVNDPTKGYGIFIENMLAESEKSN
ncbi:MAG: SpoIVB peptidase [Clostridia bacterium]|nr:SpoIVB peptidase [Clostridia bacterium]